MNDDLQKQLAELLKHLAGAANDAGQWVAGQLPPLVQEKIAFWRVSETLDLLLCGVATYVCWRLMRFGYEKEQTNGHDDHPGWVFLMIFSGIGSVVFIVVAWQQLQTVALVWFAPRLYIVEWLTNLVKK